MSVELVPNVSSRLIEFANLLRANDYAVNPGSIEDAHRVADCLQIQHLHDLRHGFRACFCVTPNQWKRFDRLFYAFWFDQIEVDENASGNDTPGPAQRASQNQRLVGFAGTSSDQEASVNLYGSGDYNALSLADFRFVFNAREKALIDQYVDELAQRARRRFTRKKRISSTGSRIALRQSIRQSLRYQGTAFELKYTRPRKKLPEFVLLLDISQSMDVYARLFLRFTRKLLSVFEQSYAFAFNIALIDLGKGHSALEENDFELAINSASQGWVGGTRIAGSLETFNRDYLQSTVSSRTTVLIFSDGCDTDTPEQLKVQLETISRQARRIIWVNPLLGRFDGGYNDPRMETIVPLLDHYMSAHNLPSLQKLQQVLLR